MLRRWLLFLAMGTAAPVFAEGPINPGTQDHWINLGKFHGPWGGAEGYTDVSARTRQPAAMPNGQYLVYLWLVLDEPHDLADGKVTQIEIHTRVDCPTQSVGDDDSTDYYGPDGHLVSSQSSGSEIYSLSKPGMNTASAKLIETFFS